MRIDNSFTVALPVEDAWTVLRDVERIAPCMPGAEIREIAEGEYRGVLKLRLGGVAAEYEGAVRVAEVDQVGRRVVLRAEGRETGGQGDASAAVTARLRPADASRTEVVVETDLTVSGRIAQFGQGVMADVSSELTADFARCLDKEVQSAVREVVAPAPTPEEVVADEIGDLAVEDPERAAQLVSAVTTGPVGPRPAEPVARPGVSGNSVAERAVPAAIVGVLLLQVLPKGRLKRLGLAVLGSALVAGLLAGKQQQQPPR